MRIKDFFRSSEDPTILSMWKYDVMLNDTLKNFVLNKFFRSLEKICKDENIKLTVFENIQKLNDYGWSKEGKISNLEAAGIYGYRISIDSGKHIVNDKFPYIYLYKHQYNTMTFAHELGHHFAVTQLNDDSEETADAYIQILAEECLSNIERYALNTSLNVFSRLNFPRPKITRKEWKEYKKLHCL